MKTKPESTTAFSTPVDSPVSKATPATEHPAKKIFAEPELSNPVDVLEATTFFQGPESGVTN